MLKWGDGGLFTHHSSVLSQHVMVGQLSFWPCQGINDCADVTQCVLQTIHLTCQTVNFCQQSCLVSGKSLYLVVEIGDFSFKICDLSFQVGLLSLQCSYVSFQCCLLRSQCVNAIFESSFLALQTVYLGLQSNVICFEIIYFGLQSCRLSVHVGLKACCLTVVDDCQKSPHPNDY